VAGRLLLDLDVPDLGDADPADAAVIGGQPAVVWDVERLRLHLVRGPDGHLVTIDLSGDEPRAPDLPPLVASQDMVQVFRRMAVPSADGDRLYVSGMLDRHIGGTFGVRRFATVPLEPLVLDAESGEVVARGVADGAEVIAADRRQVAFVDRGGAEERLRIARGESLAWIEHPPLPGALVAASFDESETHIALAIRRDDAITLHRSRVDGSGGIGPALAELGGGSEVHLDAGVAFELSQ
jgi:hypothetical protein